MSRSGLTLAAAAAAILIATPGPLLAGAVILDLKADPLSHTRGAPALEVQGAGTDLFLHDPSTPRVFPSDAPGSLLARYDSTRPTTRAVATLGAVYTEQDDFVFGAIVTIRPEVLEADPFGFHPITFSLINTATTGFDRTGTLSDFRADTFDTVDVAYFPQVSPLFGGPYLAPAVFGSPISDDAFASFTFGSVPFEIAPGAPHLITAEHDADANRLVVSVWALGRGGLPVPLPGGRVEVSLEGAGGFAVDALAITAYEDGFNVFTQSGRSVRADLDYDLLFFAPGSLDESGSLPSLTGILRRSSEGAHGLNGD